MFSAMSIDGPGRYAKRWGVFIVLALVFCPLLTQAEAPDIAARAAVLMNPVTGEIIFAKAPHRRLPPASTTKVLTTLLALEHLNLNARVPVSPGAANTVPSRIGLRPGEKLYVQDLLYGVMLKSGNDAAEVVAEAVGGSVSGFARMMTAKARLLGAVNSNFKNPHGLPHSQHYSTAYDLALIFRQAMRDPVFAEIVRTRAASLRIENSRESASGWRLKPVRNSNRLLASYWGARGGKTGYTRAARRCFVGEAQRGQQRLIVVVLGSPNKRTIWNDVRLLFDYGFANDRVTPAAAKPVLIRSGPRLSRQPS